MENKVKPMGVLQLTVQAATDQLSRICICMVEDCQTGGLGLKAQRLTQ